MAKKNLLQERIVYKPFEYQEAADYWLKQQQAHWLHTEVPMMSDLTDWNSNLNETEKNIIGSILKGFAQTETVVNDYWSGLVTKWFRKPEVIMMATTFGAFETIHAEAYSLLNETLGLENFAEFMEDEATMAKIENLTAVRDSFNGEKDLHEIAKSLAIFSAFTEGVKWSIRDESLHSEAGCWLFRTLVSENPELKTPELEAAINEAALLSLQLELDFIRKCYSLGDLEGCPQYDLEHFIKNRVNTKLGDLGYKGIVGNIDVTAVERMKWFDHLSAGKQHTDFFANRVTNYSKGHLTWDESIF
jgi:ribonucleoside-diphosphate reductase beta chain